jgi:hypothetical protein
MSQRYINISILLMCTCLSAACAKSVSHPIDSPLSMTSDAGDRHVLAGEWEYEDSTGIVLPLKLDEQGNGHYDWKGGRFETRMLVNHTWKGKWFQEGNDRDGGFLVEFSPDFSEGEGQWWISRIGTDYAPMQKGGTFHLSKKTASMSQLRKPQSDIFMMVPTRRRLAS